MLPRYVEETSIFSSLTMQTTDTTRRGQAAIAENAIAMFSKSYCGFCRRAGNLLQSEFPGVPVKVLQCVS